MAGIMLYIVTLLLESISVIVRFGIVSGLVSLFAGGTAGVAAGAAAGLGPIIYSLLVVGGIPSGHILVRRSLKARPLSRAERGQLEAALEHIWASAAPFPQHVFVVDAEGLNAAISGRTMYIYRELLDSRHLAGVVAHELGHYNSTDGRLLLGIRALTIPGGFFMAYLLIGLLRWVAYGISTVLMAFLIIILAFFRINLSGLAGSIFGICLQILRMGIIFGVGGVGPALLGSIWRSYFLEREFAADAYAGRLGYAYDLLDFFETEVLSDVAIPWYERPTHPTATRRMANLEEIAARHPQVHSWALGAHQTRLSPPAATHAARLQPAANVRPRGKGARSSRPAWLIPLAAGLLAMAIIGGGIMLSITPLAGAPATDMIRPTPGPTPTLGIITTP